MCTSNKDNANLTKKIIFSPINFNLILFYHNVKGGLVRYVTLYFAGGVWIDLVYLKYNFRMCVKSLISILKIYSHVENKF